MDRYRNIHRDLASGEKGHFTLENQDGVAHLTVYPPGKGGDRVRPDDVFARLELFGFEEFDENEIRDIVADASGVPVAVCPWKEPDPVDATAKIDIAADGMEASIELGPARFGGKELDQPGVLEILQKEGVRGGIDEEAIREALRRKAPFRVIVARGKRPAPGRPARIRHYFLPSERPVPEIEEGGRVDFKDIRVIQSAREGDLLAELVESTPGHPGFTVRGEVLESPAPGSAELEAGKNTVFSEDGSRVFAGITGQVRIHGERPAERARIEMEEILDLENVDYSTGHIDFPGSVVIRGRVADGFHVRAGGDIQVEKSVGTVRLEAEGHILLSGGIVSRSGGYIRAGGCIYARFVENAALHAGDGIFIEEAVMHSRLTAGNRINVEGGRGEVMGGVLICGKELRARKIGARIGTPTRINAGLDPGTLEKLRDLDGEFEDRFSTLRKVETHIGQLEESRRRGRELSGEENENLEKLRLIRDKLRSHLENLELQREKIYGMIEADPDASVVATEFVYPGVEISFGAGVRKYRVEGRPVEKYSRFILEHGAVVLRHSDL